MTSGKFHYLGRSSDCRTNAWRLTLPCGHDATPPTTMLASQIVSCPRCTTEFWVNYNDQTMKAVEYLTESPPCQSHTKRDK